MSGRGTAATATRDPRRAVSSLQEKPWSRLVRSIEVGTRLHQALALRMVEACVVSLALWCALYTLQVLPGSARQETGAATMVLGGIAAGVLRARRWLIAALCAATTTVAVVVFTSLSNSITERWVRNDHLPANPPDAVVVLSGGLNPDTTITSEALDHLVTALELLRDRHVNVLLTTTTREEFPGGTVDGRIDQERILQLTGLHARWIQVSGGHTTHDEAVSAAAVLQPRALRRVAIVTSPMHTRRACAVFERVGFEVTCVAARLRGIGALPLQDVPDDRLAVFGDWIYEVAATMEYRVRGWLPT